MGEGGRGGGVTQNNKQEYQNKQKDKTNKHHE